MNQPRRRSSSTAGAAGRRSRLAAGMFAVLGGVAIVNLPITILLARTLDPAGYGAFQFVNRLVFIVVSVAQLGLPHALSWAMTRSDSDSERLQIYRFAARSSVVSGVGAAVVCVALLAPAGSFSLPAVIIAASLPLTNLLPAAIANAARGAADLRAVATIRIVQVVVWATAVLFALSFERMSVEVALGALLVSQLVSSIVSLWQIRSPRGAQGVEAARLRTRYIWSFAQKVFLGHTVWSWNQYLDQVVIGIFLSKTDVGIYAFASGLVLALNLLNNPLSATAQPIIQQTPEGDRESFVARMLATTTIVVGLGAILVCIVTPFVVYYIVGGAYQSAIVLVYILAFGAVLDAWNGCCHGALVGSGFPGLSSKNAVSGLLANVVGWSVLLPVFGVLGAAITSVCAHLVVTVLMIRSTSKVVVRDSNPIGLLAAIFRALPGTPRALLSLLYRKAS